MVKLSDALKFSKKQVTDKCNLIGQAIIDNKPANTLCQLSNNCIAAVIGYNINLAMQQNTKIIDYQNTLYDLHQKWKTWVYDSPGSFKKGTGKCPCNACWGEFRMSSGLFGLGTNHCSCAYLRCNGDARCCNPEVYINDALDNLPGDAGAKPASIETIQQKYFIPVPSNIVCQFCPDIVKLKDIKSTSVSQFNQVNSCVSQATGTNPDDSKVDDPSKMIIPEYPKLPTLSPETLKPTINNYEKYAHYLPFTAAIPAIPSVVCIICILLVILLAYNTIESSVPEVNKSISMEGL